MFAEPAARFLLVDLRYCWSLAHQLTGVMVIISFVGSHRSGIGQSAGHQIAIGVAGIASVVGGDGQVSGRWVGGRQKAGRRAAVWTLSVVP
ncbi:MAG: hypothetical protein IPN78_10345 [Candidatus Accumulibacter sp.]|nr:hypothetical protein [Candidatus Accumulibacter propinquus]